MNIQLKNIFQIDDQLLNSNGQNNEKEYPFNIINNMKDNDNIFNDYYLNSIEMDNSFTGLTDNILPKTLFYNNTDINNNSDSNETNIIMNNQLIRGRKKTNTKSKGLHDKYSQDNILRRIKCIILINIYNYINKKIYEIYKGKIGKGIFEKKLKKINSKNNLSNSKNNNIELLNKTLKDIFCDNISIRYTNYKNDHNKKIINDLLNEKNEEIREQFKKLFSLTFLECLIHFREQKYFEELDGLENLDTVCKKFDDDQHYVDLFKYNVLNYEKIIMDKKSRNRKNNNNRKDVK